MSGKKIIETRTYDLNKYKIFKQNYLKRNIAIIETPGLLGKRKKY